MNDHNTEDVKRSWTKNFFHLFHFPEFPFHRYIAHDFPFGSHFCRDEGFEFKLRRVIAGSLHGGKKNSVVSCEIIIIIRAL